MNKPASQTGRHAWRSYGHLDERHQLAVDEMPDVQSGAGASTGMTAGGL
jgi:hypothetical protein